MRYKIMREDETGYFDTIWVEADNPCEAEDMALNDPNVAGCEIIGVFDPEIDDRWGTAY